ncbi:hypothetical protein BDY17DRAFT_60335 [Neohortaea acidophila]|uniref:Uncharacterized protein n=1 Tax=Neohortaea acidophila TaxID=245834 RepID=A0A6A6PHT8_9PEZI|nr:uncharacterized protein BDY17DRAFT_60335 [Neohortaea acidophila]KAF2478837.1 hypothetical protein BDY17DRAFT_60335 [Neohortaea acidophila]
MNLTVRVAGRQSGRQRMHNGPRDPRPSLQWRANLTGLSQVHNLYFVAYGPDIHVYEPQYPTQAVSKNPLLFFTSSPSAPGLAGYIDPTNPHAINNLVVQFLGNEEVVAVVRDDGDVDAFLIRHVVGAIARRAESSMSYPPFEDGIRPFFQANVEKSAWGLSIHAQARVLAVSSNAHEVRVFKFGLLHAHDPDSSEHEDDAATADRATDVTHQILNGEANIPYISFCNTGDDPEGRWLLTTDISGECRVMDLRALKTVQHFRLGGSRHFLSWYDHNFDRNHAGWLIMFLDRRSFQEAETVSEALGLMAGEMPPNLKRNPMMWDLSGTVQHLPGYETPLIYSNESTDGRRRRDEDPRPGNDQRAPAWVQLVDEDERDDVDSDQEAPLEIEIEINDPMSEDESQEEPSYTLNPTEAQPHATILGPSESPTSPMSYESDSEGSPSSIPIIDDASDPDAEPVEDPTHIPYNALYNGQAISSNTPKYAIDHDQPFCADLPCPILHASVRDIYLLQPSHQATQRGPHAPPTLGFANPLRQRIDHRMAFLLHFQRLNMTAYIPDLGAVIIASQKGRAIVLALTKITAETEWEEEMLLASSSTPGAASGGSVGKQGSKQHRPPPWTQKTIYAMRVQCILPFAEQEKAHERPFAPLHGLAAAPLQGCEAGRQRWRVLMMYQDHSVLSYEISRGRAEAGGIGVEAVAV